MEEIKFPLQSEYYTADYIIRKKKSLKREILESRKDFVEKKVAILCGPTLSEVKDTLELFLLYNGIRPIFYVSEYNKYFEDAVFSNDILDEFRPDIIYIFTTYRSLDVNINLSMKEEDIDKCLNSTFEKYNEMWDKLQSRFNTIIIQNNFELPNYRFLGNKDVSDSHGLVNFISRLNTKFYEKTSSKKDMFICDINYIAADYGLNKWHNENLYALYKCPCDINAMPSIAFNVANIIKSIYGKNKKSLVLDLDNTLWGGILAEDGAKGLKIGPETAEGEIYLAFQKYIKKFKELGVVLNIASKNDATDVMKALDETDGVLKKDDFIKIKADFNNKDENIKNIAKELNLGVDSLVFLDDNAVERALVRENVKGVETPPMLNVDDYIKTLDHTGFFECTNLTNDDLARTQQYNENAKREEYKSTFKDYDGFLDSLEMKAEIMPFSEKYFDRISQLTNKSNQFNLTTKRCEVDYIAHMASNKRYITLYGKLVDKFGDNGLVSVVAGKVEQQTLEITIFLMSCRVLKREMEKAMMDELVRLCIERGIDKIKGFYFKTEKNAMVKDLFDEFGFIKMSEKDNGDSEWELNDLVNYKKLCKHIKVNN